MLMVCLWWWRWSGSGHSTNPYWFNIFYVFPFSVHAHTCNSMMILWMNNKNNKIFILHFSIAWEIYFSIIFNLHIIELIFILILIHVTGSVFFFHFLLLLFASSSSSSSSYTSSSSTTIRQAIIESGIFVKTNLHTIWHKVEREQIINCCK